MRAEHVHEKKKRSAKMLPAAVFEIAPDVDRERINQWKYIHPMEQNRTKESLYDWSGLTIFSSTGTGMNEFICFTPFRIKRLKVPED